MMKHETNDGKEAHDSVPTARRWRAAALVGMGLAAVLPAALSAAEAPRDLRSEATAALKRAATFYRTQVASHGGYAYFYTPDLSERWGEGVGTRDQVWVEPPGTPAVGRAYLEAYAATHDPFYLEAATETGQALVYGQLKSGGWRQTIDFNPKGDRSGDYRNGRGHGMNYSSLDDDQTQAAIQFMVRLDQALDFKNEKIHEVTLFALNSLLQAQFPNGGFPQGWKEPAPNKPIIKAHYPKEWPRLWPHEAYHTYYTLNDGLVGTVSDALLLAYETYHDERYKQALARLGDFLILAQMPEPQPAWCQQYNFNMEPTWARKFEPPAVCGLESEDAVKTLMKIYRVTGDRKYLAPLPRAIAYLQTCLLPDGRMPRYRELETNRPLYMNRKPGVSGSSNAPGYYDLTYSDKDLPKHYGWKQPSSINELAAEFAAIDQPGAAKVVDGQTFTEAGKLIAVARVAGQEATAEELAPDVQRIIAALDDQGRWITTHDGSKLVGQPNFKKGFRYIGSNVFNHHVEQLSAYIAATAK
ncbi:pectate lyase [Horticoccus luteus]|uniref:Pectate lyase n=1 Tax=Horticoccus luteus TaxID=2862869 RepID=A0A8F9XKU2_9BACT|nr:pectate lyase [Horticoccus luteus]QYM78551.1 pectate lyase [Horticoccus luteus]